MVMVCELPPPKTLLLPNVDVGPVVLLALPKRLVLGWLPNVVVLLVCDVEPKRPPDGVPKAGEEFTPNPNEPEFDC